MANIDLVCLIGLWSRLLVSCKTCCDVGWMNWSLRSGSGEEFEEMKNTSSGWCDTITQDKVSSVSYPVL